MYLQNVDVRNFRALKELHVDLQPGLNMLVGRNNTGKTTLLQAIRHALGPGASRGDALWLERDDFYRESPTAEPESSLAVTLTFGDLKPEERAYFFEIVDFDLTDVEKSTAVIRFEASWPKGQRQASIRRTGGPEAPEAPDVPVRLLESLPITFLPALRDAEAALAPGYRSRLARLLRDLATRREREGDNVQGELVQIFSTANEQLEAHPLIRETGESLQATTQHLAGTDYSVSAIRAAAIDFDRILRSLQIQMKDAPIEALDSNGLGYNNLLYMAVVLEHLRAGVGTEVPLLLVEEPEAHLHPQLTMLLARYLATDTPGKSRPQTIITTHSPTLAANVVPSCLNVLFASADNGLLTCNSIASAGMDVREEAELQRMMDITKATLYFAKGAILVEGISEALLVPALSRRLGHDLATLHISVIPICGVSFLTLKKLLEPTALGIPVAIITDADPRVQDGANWAEAVPAADGAGFEVSSRTKRLLAEFQDHPNVAVFHSEVTLEYDLAKAGLANAEAMARVWETCFEGTPRAFNTARIAQAGNDAAGRALAAWRGICRADTAGSKADFAHRLAAYIEERTDINQPARVFDVPEYIAHAVEYVVDGVTQLPGNADGTVAMQA